MNRTLKLAFGAVLGTMLAMPALAQENFPDVPENHWVFQALLNMKNEGILVGYPDGMFRGGRPASRYELAGAINAAYQKLKGMIGGLSSQIDAIKAMIGDGVATKADLDALRAELEKLKQDMAAMARWGDDIANLKRMADKFEKDLAGIGVDVEAMKKDMSDLAARVGALEKVKPAVDIHGDVNAVMHAGHSSDGFFGITVDERPEGVGRGAASGDPVGSVQDLSVGHEAAFAFSGTNDTGPKWHATLVVGNLVGYNPFVADGGGSGGFESSLYGDQANLQHDLAFHEQNESVYFQDFCVDFDTQLFGHSMTVSLGREGHKSGNYFFQRIDNTPYFSNGRWDDGRFYMDGVNLGMKWGGGAGLNIWAGRNSTRDNSNDFFITEMWPIWTGPVASADVYGIGAVMVDRSLGVDLNFKLGNSGDAMFHYIMLDTDNPGVDPVGGASYNRVTVWGGEANWMFGNALGINAGYSRSDLSWNTSNVLSDNNFAYWAQGHFNLGKAGVNIGWRHIEPYFSAPGDWGRMGFLWNQTDHEGFFGDLSFGSGTWMAKVAAYYYQGLNGVILPADSKWTGVNASLNFKMGGAWNAMLGWEWAKFDDGIAFTPNVNWFRVGLNRDMADGSTFRFMYEMSRYDDDGSNMLGFFGVGGLGSDTDRRGGLSTIQWSKKF